MQIIANGICLPSAALGHGQKQLSGVSGVGSSLAGAMPNRAATSRESLSYGHTPKRKPVGATSLAKNRSSMLHLGGSSCLKPATSKAGPGPNSNRQIGERQASSGALLRPSQLFSSTSGAPHQQLHLQKDEHHH